MKEIIASLKTKLGTISGIQQVFMYRNANPTQYPAIVCNWESSNNSFETTSDNKKRVTFRLYIIVNVSGQTMEVIDENIIPNAFDKVAEYFDANWNFGTNVDGHRVWTTLSLANSEISVEDKSKIAYLDCVLELDYLADN